MTGSAHNYSLLVSFIVIVMLGGMLGWLAIENRGDQKTDIRVGGHTLKVDIADDNEERLQGLSGRSTLEPRTGMLFVFPDGINTCIWMKGMLIPLDIMWFDANGSLIDMRRNVPPESYPESFCPATPAKYVLELPSGSIDALGFEKHLTELEAVAF